MKNQNVDKLPFDQWKVDEVVANVPGAKEALRASEISATTRFSLANAAAATSTRVDELTAVLYRRMRRAAVQPSTERVAAEEGELVA